MRVGKLGNSAATLGSQCLVGPQQCFIVPHPRHFQGIWNLVQQFAAPTPQDPCQDLHVRTSAVLIETHCLAQDLKQQSEYKTTGKTAAGRHTLGAFRWDASGADNCVGDGTFQAGHGSWGHSPASLRAIGVLLSVMVWHSVRGNGAVVR